MTTSEAVNVSPRKISNSEVSTWLVCKYQYYLQFDLGLEPIHYKEALSRGILGHDVLAVYYKHLKDGFSHEDAVIAARSHLMQYMNGAVFDLEIVLEVDRILAGYFGYCQNDNWKILHVEEQFDVYFTAEFEFSMRLDLLIQDMNTGEVILVDHKFVYDFWTQDDLQLNPQLPKYIGALRINNFKVDKVILNQIRYRKIKEPRIDQLFQRTPYQPSNQKIVNAVRDQVTLSQEIMAWRELPLEVREKRATRVLSKMICRMCPVKNLCRESFNGAPIDYLIASEYKKREYGYNEPSSATLEALI